jgi:hypothetical protein
MDILPAKTGLLVWGGPDESKIRLMETWSHLFPNYPIFSFTPPTDVGCFGWRELTLKKGIKRLLKDRIQVAVIILLLHDRNEKQVRTMFRQVLQAQQSQIYLVVVMYSEENYEEARKFQTQNPLPTFVHLIPPNEQQDQNFIDWITSKNYDQTQPVVETRTLDGKEYDVSTSP